MRELSRLLSIDGNGRCTLGAGAAGCDSINRRAIDCVPIHAPFLKYFREVARCGSIRLAARRLYVASSAVNRQILKIEDELGVKLFERTPSGMELTAAGDVLANHVERTLAEADRTIAEISAIALGVRPPITIAAQESVIAEFLPKALVLLHAEYPDVLTAFKAAGGRDLSRLLNTGAADLALAFDNPPAPGIECVASCALAVGAIVSPQHPLAGESGVTLQDCAEFPIVLPDQTWPLRDLLDAELSKSGVEPNVVTSSNSVEFLRLMLDRQFGIGFQTVVGIESQVAGGELVHVPLRTPEPVLQEFGIWLSSSRPRPESLLRLVGLLETRMEAYTEHA